MGMCRTDRINKKNSSLSDISINLKTEFNTVLETPLAMKTSEWKISHGLVLNLHRWWTFSGNIDNIVIGNFTLLAIIVGPLYIVI